MIENSIIYNFAASENVTVTRRKTLIAALRAPMPENFEWDFKIVLDYVLDDLGHKCGTVGCAIGLAQTIWKDEDLDGDDIIENFLGLSEQQVQSIFYWFNTTYGVDTSEITPEMVAAELEKTLP